MNAEQYRKAIERLDLSQVKAGSFLGVDPRTSRRLALDEVPIPKSVSMLLRLMVRLKLKPDDVS